MNNTTKQKSNTEQKIKTSIKFARRRNHTKSVVRFYQYDHFISFINYGTLSTC